MPASVTTPEPSCVRLPVPVIEDADVESASLKRRLPLLTTLVPPIAPPVPTWSVPPLIVAVPL